MKTRYVTLFTSRLKFPDPFIVHNYVVLSIKLRIPSLESEKYCMELIFFL